MTEEIIGQGLFFYTNNGECIAFMDRRTRCVYFRGEGLTSSPETVLHTATIRERYKGGIFFRLASANDWQMYTRKVKEGKSLVSDGTRAMH
jgi:hypothetical protein